VSVRVILRFLRELRKDILLVICGRRRSHTGDDDPVEEFPCLKACPSAAVSSPLLNNPLRTGSGSSLVPSRDIVDCVRRRDGPAAICVIEVSPMPDSCALTKGRSSCSYTV
jgi:hypothetical protein